MVFASILIKRQLQFTCSSRASQVLSVGGEEVPGGGMKEPWTLGLWRPEEDADAPEPPQPTDNEEQSSLAKNLMQVCNCFCQATAVGWNIFFKPALLKSVMLLLPT